MPFTRAGQLARHSPTARADDPLPLVAENLRAAHCGTIPILDRFVPDPEWSLQRKTPEPVARVLGLIDERDLSGVVLTPLAGGDGLRLGSAPAVSSGAAQSATPEMPGPALLLTQTDDYSRNGVNGGHHNGHQQLPPEIVPVQDITAGQIMRVNIGIIASAFSLESALLTLDRYDCSALPVVDENGSYRGMLSRADVISAMGGQVRPPVVGGMATPLGVWLTTGSVTAGAPPLGLLLSGATLACCLVLSMLLMMVGLRHINPEWLALFVSGRLGADSMGGSDLNFLFVIIQSFLFLALLRSLPMAGIHAAEHQTVWAIEKGLPLKPEYVERMPRAHPRCGTNLGTLAGLILILFQHLPNFEPFTVILALLFIYFTWRFFGTLMQEWFTTRPASRRQIESGIRAGRELMAKFQAEGNAGGGSSNRAFFSGLALTALGMIIVETAYAFVEMRIAAFLLGV